MATRTNQYVDLVPGESVHERHDLQIELIQRHVEIDYERVEGIVIIRDSNVQVLFSQLHGIRPPSAENRVRGRTFDGFYALLQENPGESFRYDPSGHEGLKEEPLDVVCGRHDGGDLAER
jgi:hypothetical protein